MEADGLPEGGGAGYKLVLPEDGYEWKKYGQKFIKSIAKYRSYFKCEKKNCPAKKQAEWSACESENLRVHYDGIHNHASVKRDEPGSSSSTSIANPYDLFTQVSTWTTTYHDEDTN